MRRTSPRSSLGEHPVEWTLEYSRPFRALKLWLALRAHGASAFREAIEHDLALARLVADLVRAADDLELLCEPALSIVPFRRIPARRAIDEHNRGLVRALQRDGRLYVTGAVVDGQWCLRPCIVNYRTTESTTPTRWSTSCARWAAASRTRSRYHQPGRSPRNSVTDLSRPPFGD